MAFCEALRLAMFSAFSRHDAMRGKERTQLGGKIAMEAKRFLRTGDANAERCRQEKVLRSERPRMHDEVRRVRAGNEIGWRA